MARESTDQPYYPYPETNRKLASKTLEQEISRFFDDFLDYRQIIYRASHSEGLTMAGELAKFRLGVTVPPFRRQIVAPAGMGKTTLVAKNIKRLWRGETVWYVVPTHKLAAEVELTLKDHTREKTACDSNVEIIIVKGRSEETCQRYQMATSLGSKGVNVQNSLCDNGKELCPFFDDCPYQEQRRKIKNLEELGDTDPPRVFVMAHSYLTSNSNIPKPNLVIVDESHWQTFIDITGQSNTLSDLSFSDLIEASDPSLEHCNAYIEVTTKIISVMQKHPVGFLRPLSKIVSDLLEAAIKHIGLVISKHSISKITPKHSDNLIRKYINCWEVPKLRKIKELLLILSYELKRKKGISSIVCNLDNSKPIRLHSTKQGMIDKLAPVLLIDASASYDINEKIWGHHLQKSEVRAERNAEIIQVRQRTFSKSSLGIPYNSDGNWEPKEEHLKFRQEVIKFVNEVSSETTGTVFFAASKRIEEELKGTFDDNVLTSHFGDLRGRNDFEHCDVGIILGREEPSVASIEGSARALLSRNKNTFSSNSDYIRTERNRRLKNGMSDPEIVRSHIDPFCQKVLEQIRERELEQAIDRMRLIYNVEPKTIYILTSVVLDVTVDFALKWDELAHLSKMDRAIQETLICEKAFPLGATDIARCFPSLWSSRDAARKYIKRRGGIKWVISLIRYYIPNGPLLLVEYRRVGQRGKSSRAIVMKNGMAPRTALENAFGPISKFKIIQRYYKDEDYVD